MTDEKAYQDLAKTLVEEFYRNQNQGLVTNLNKRNYENLGVTREKLIANLKDQMKEYTDENGRSLTEEEKEKVLDLIKRDLWGYGILDPLIHNPRISDIKTYSAGDVRIKTQGKRSGAGVTFENTGAYQNFVQRILERNKINLGTANAIQTFTDSSQEDFILRITAMSGLLTDSGLPCIAFRKIPKEKYTLRTLEDAGMFGHRAGGRGEKQKEAKQSAGKQFLSDATKESETMDRLLHQMISSKGILFTGKGASGKTTLMNAMLAEIPHDESIMICQENSELFDQEHPDLLAAHVLVNGGDSKVSYTLGDLTRAALLMDLDRVIVGEVKEGSEAAGLSKASMTGHKCWTSVHGESCEMAVDKMADYISQATGYGTREALKQLTGFEYVVHLRNFHIDEIKRIDGWDKKTDSMILTPVYPFSEKSRQTERAET
jgi:Flp pilus assembly CpaF family ATPase